MQGGCTIQKWNKMKHKEPIHDGATKNKNITQSYEPKHQILQIRWKSTASIFICGINTPAIQTTTKGDTTYQSEIFKRKMCFNDSGKVAKTIVFEENILKKYSSNESSKNIGL